MAPDEGNGDETDVTTMADVNLDNEAKNLRRPDVATEIRHAPGGDEQIYVNKQGYFFTHYLKNIHSKLSL